MKHKYNLKNANLFTASNIGIASYSENVIKIYNYLILQILVTVFKHFQLKPFQRILVLTIMG